MVREKIERIRSNVTSSVLVFQCASDGYVPFYVVDKIDRVNGMISISVAVAIGQKIGLDDEIELRLVRCKLIDGGYNYCTLDKLRFDTPEHKIKVDSEINMQKEEYLGEDYGIKHNYTYTFRDIPVPEAGRYAVSLGIPDDDLYFTFAAYYFDVVDKVKTVGLGNLLMDKKRNF